MADLSEVLPNFDLTPYRHLTHSLQKNDITVAELISLDPIEIAKRCPLPLGDLKALVTNIVTALQADLGFVHEKQKVKGTSSDILAADHGEAQESIEDINIVKEDGEVRGRLRDDVDIPMVRVLDPRIDECLGGGFHTGHLTEVVGESAVGKTQFVLGLLLSAQLKPPHGLGRSAVYLSTEAPLNTARLSQMLNSHPFYEALDPNERPSLDRIHTISTNNLETQDNIIQHQLPLAVQRFDVGLIVMDSVAANFRAEHETKDAKSLADRAVDLTKLGNMLRRIARDYNVAVVVANQVSDRFDDARTMQDRIRSSSPFMGSSPMLPPIPKLPPASGNRSTGQDEYMTLDHQQRFFTGWGDQPTTWFEQLKTPALGLSWANQLSARIVLKMESERVFQHAQDYLGGNIWKDKKKRRYAGVVFAPWAPQTLDLVEYEITSQGIVSVLDTEKVENEGDGSSNGVDQAILDPSLWFDGAVEDEEFP